MSPVVLCLDPIEQWLIDHAQGACYSYHALQTSSVGNATDLNSSVYRALAVFIISVPLV
jgi:hypothetical protein